MDHSRHQFDVLDSFVDSIAIVDAHGSIIFTNKAWDQFAQENAANAEKTSIGINYLDICKKVTGEALKEASIAASGIQSVIKGKKDLFEMEYPCHSADEKRWFMMRINPLLPFSGLILVSHINITARKLAEEYVEKSNNQLRSVNGRLNVSLHRIAHDIQAPLSSIEGLLYLTKAEGKVISPYLVLIEKSVAKLKAFIQDTLTISTVSKTESIHFKSLLQSLFESVKYARGMDMMEVDVHVTQHSDFICDKAELASVLSNLIDNAIKYQDHSKARKSLVITILVSEQEATTSILDNGIGISKEILPQIFDLNFQANKGSHAGAGIGLHIVRKCIERMRGTISVNSVAGEGTEFIISLPNLKQQGP